MLKLSFQAKDGRLGVMLVLEPGNLEMLRAGKPIVVHLEELLPALPRTDVVIHFTNDVEKTSLEIRRHFDIGRFVDERAGKVQ